MGAGVRGGGGSWGRLIITAVVSAVCTGAIVAAVCVWAFTPRWPQKLNSKKNSPEYQNLNLITQACRGSG